MDLSMLKTQFMTMTMMKSNQQQADIYSMLYSMIMISIIEWIFKQIPILAVLITDTVKPLVTQWVSINQKTLLNSSSLLTPKEQVTLSTVTLFRTFKDGSSSSSSSSKNQVSEDNPVIERVDAVLDHMCTLDATHHIRMDTRISLNTTNDIELTPFLKAKINQTLGASETIIEVVLTSSILKVSEIRRWIDEIHSAYVAEKNNKLGNRIYYFDEIPAEPQIQMDVSNRDMPARASYKWDSMPRALTFSMNEFNTSKSFSNVYGNHVDDLKERLDLFLKQPDWYRERGIPHTLGILLSGVPGAGKTSTFKAIIKDTKRHPFVIKLRPYTTQQQLKNLFYNETIVVQNADGQKQTFKIPLNKRIILIEDIGAMTDVVLDREKFPLRTQPEGDAVTLEFLLNLIDGVLETPGRILGISDNYPENLDRALIRPGRIDVRINFGYVDISYLRDMFTRFFKLTDVQTPVLDPAVLAGIFTPAEVMECMCNHYKDPVAALAQLTQKAHDRRGLPQPPIDPEEAVPVSAVDTPVDAEETPVDAEETPVSAEETPVDDDVFPKQPREEGVIQLLPDGTPKRKEDGSSHLTHITPDATVKEKPYNLDYYTKFNKCNGCKQWFDKQYGKEHECSGHIDSLKYLCLTTPPAHTITTYPRQYMEYSWDCPNEHEESTDSRCKYCVDEIIQYSRKKDAELMSRPIRLHEPFISLRQATAENNRGGISEEKNKWTHPITESSSIFSGFGGGGDDGFASVQFSDDVPPPGAPPFDISMFAGSQRNSYNLNPDRS